MFMIRLIFVLLVITAMVLFGCYLLLDDQKYLRYFKKTLHYSLFFVVIVAILLVLRRIIYV